MLLFHLFENRNRGKCCYNCRQRKWDYTLRKYYCDISRKQTSENYICTNFIWQDEESNLIHREWTFPPAARP